MDNKQKYEVLDERSIDKLIDAIFGIDVANCKQVLSTFKLRKPKHGKNCVCVNSEFISEILYYGVDNGKE